MRRFLLGLGFASTVAVLAGCPVSPPALCDYGACDPPDGAVVDGGDSGFDAPPGCDLTKDPKDSLPCVTDSVGIFVSSTGSDANDGSKAKPVATIGKALSLIGTKPRIYVCEGNYPGSVDIAKTVGIYGGFKCDWTPSATKPVLLADKPAYAVKITQPNVSLVDLDIQAKDASAPGESSIAVLVSGSAGIALRRSKLTAGAGVDGASPAITNYVFPDPSTKLNGVNSPGNGGGSATSIVCPKGDSSTGGKGGDTGADGDPGLPSGAGGAKGIAGPNMSTACTAGGNGDPGANSNPAPSPTSLGTLGVSGWMPGSGASGLAGAAGQGGGGGGGQVSGVNSGGGGGGGAGACGGAGGPGGGGGGASIGLAAIDSIVTLSTCEVVVGKAGNGGKGAPGQPGQSIGGIGGLRGNGSALGCQAGSGGRGGDGGSGSGGAGGVSVGILYKTTKPTTDNATDGKITVGTKGNKGLGGSSPTNDGIDGVAQAVLQAP